MIFPANNIRLSHHQYLNNFPKLRLGGQEVDYVTEYKYLGIVINMQLKFVKYMTQLTTTIAYRLSILSRIRSAITQSTALMLYKSMILTLFDYGSLFYRGVNISLINKLQVYQNKAIRIICLLPKRQNTDDLHKNLNLLFLEERRNLQMLLMAFNLSFKQEFAENTEKTTPSRPSITTRSRNPNRRQLENFTPKISIVE